MKGRHNEKMYVHTKFYKCISDVGSKSFGISTLKLLKLAFCSRQSSIFKVNVFLIAATLMIWQLYSSIFQM